MRDGIKGVVIFGVPFFQLLSQPVDFFLLLGLLSEELVLELFVLLLIGFRFGDQVSDLLLEVCSGLFRVSESLTLSVEIELDVVGDLDLLVEG